MGLIVDIFRASYNSPLNVFEGVRELTIVNVDGPFLPNALRPAAMLVDGHRPGDKIVVPAGLDTSGDSPKWVRATAPDAAGPMFGGSYAGTSDSRFDPGFYGAVPIHDRFEFEPQTGE